jgi:4-diphosphocytidyl-2-C-methyl-D-erythritol kinase
MTEAWSSWAAPAKLNLFLHIVGRRADGYHRLQTVFQLLDWGDSVHLRVRQDGAIVRLRGVQDIEPAKDLAVRAAHALRAAAGTHLGADIDVEKTIPAGGGLGGGSSDAATVLVALNELWQTQLSIDALAQLAVSLGADVPVFVRGHSAWAEGIGDELTPIDLPSRCYVVVDPHVPVPTAALFQAPELTRNSPQLKISGFLDSVATANVFAPVVRARFPVVAAALDWLGQWCEARLSGSGGCVFGAVDSLVQAQGIARQCPAQFTAYVAHGVNASPLLSKLERYREDRGHAGRQ